MYTHTQYGEEMMRIYRAFAEFGKKKIKYVYIT